MRKALVAIAKDEDNYLEEWLEYHTMLGFNEIYVFCNDWMPNFNMPKDGHVKLIPITGKGMQLEAYNFFIDNFSDRCDVAAFIDVDEFIVTEDLEALCQSRREYPQFFLNWRLFGSNEHENVVDGNYSVITRFTKSQKDFNIHIKQFLNFETIRNHGLHIHFPNPHCTDFPSVSTSRDTRPVIGPWYQQLGANPNYIAHYATKSRMECKERRSKDRGDEGAPRPEGWEEFFKAHDINEVSNFDVANIFSRSTQCHED